MGPSVLYLCDADNAHPIYIFFPLVPRLRIELAPPALEAWNLNHWTTWEVPLFSYSSLYNTHFFLRYNSHTIQFILLKLYDTVVFSIFRIV